MFGPVIEGKTCRLRPPRVEEADIYIRFFDDTEVTRWLGNQFPPSLKFEQDWVERNASDEKTRRWVIEVDGRAVGISGIDIDLSNGVGVTGTIIGDKTVWGQGVGRETMQLRRDFAFGQDQFPFRKLRSGYVAPNIASGRAQASAGYKEVGRYHQEIYCQGRYEDLVFTEIMRSEWEALKQ